MLDDNLIHLFGYNYKSVKIVNAWLYWQLLKLKQLLQFR